MIRFVCFVGAMLTALSTVSVSARPSQAAAALDVRVMTFNIRYGTAEDGENRWEKRRGLVLELLSQEDCDVVGLQEALRGQLDAVLESCKQYKAVGVGRDDGKDQGEFAAILYRHERFEVIDSGTFWLSRAPEQVGSLSWGHTVPRICTWARLQERATWRTFYVYNVHLEGGETRARLHAMELVADRIAKRQHSEPVVLMGDLNASESSDTLRFLRGEIPGPSVPRTLPDGWVDSFRSVHPEAKLVGTFNRFAGDRTGPKIDYILVSPQSAYVVSAYILDWQKAERYPSDHFPVMARLLLGERRVN